MGLDLGGNSLGGNSADVNTLGGNSADVNTLGGNLTDVNTLGESLLGGIYLYKMFS